MIGGNLHVRPYRPEDADGWDSLVADSVNGTFLHTRRFLSYHGSRFHDVSLVIGDEKGRTVGVFPAALDPANTDFVNSHPGITYGGIVHDGSLKGSAMLKALEDIADHYRRKGISAVRYKAVPHIYHCSPASDDLYALYRLGAVRYRCDLSATIDIAVRPKLSSGKRYCLKKAIQTGVRTERGSGYIEALWDVVVENLESKHKARPVHSLEEIKHLQSLFPQNIECVVGVLDDEVIGGTVLFRDRRLVHTQYIACNGRGRDVFALYAVLDDCISRAEAGGARYFDFGTSNEQGGTILNTGLYQFKSEFGAGGVVHEFYEFNVG